MGSYLITLRAPGFAEALYPVCIARGAHWAAQGPVPLLSPGEQPPGSCYVPAGPFVCGGDPQAGFAEPRSEVELPGFLIARFPATVRDYVGFLQSLPEHEAAARAPRLMGEQGSEKHLLLRRDAEGRWALPQQDQQGDRWDPDWPIFAVSHDDASAFAASRGARLPLEHEWEKAARGVDGRLHPWGDDFDAALCWMQGSVAGRSRPSPVGARAADCSPYGVRDLAGGVRGWCGDPSFRGDPAARPVRGGAWSGAARLCRAANRFHLPANQARTWLGFRLAWDLPVRPPRGSGI